MHLPPAALAMLRRQHSVVARHQLLRWMAAATVDSLVARGHLVPVERGVYVTPYAEVTPLSLAGAALLRSVGQGNPAHAPRLTGPLVPALVGLDGFTLGAPFEVLTPPGRHLRGVAFAHRPDPTPRAPTATVHGLRTVTVTAALVDCAGRDDVDPRRVRVGIDAARARHLTTDARLVRRARTLSNRHPGARAVLQLEADGFLRCDSEKERELGHMVRRIDPRPVPQGRVGRRRVDWLWPGYRWGTEYLGDVDHAGRTAGLADQTRRTELAADGVVICELTRDDLRLGERLVRWIHVQLTLRAAELGVPPPLLRPG